MTKIISERVKELNFPLGEYVVVGGAMEAHGIRDAKDLDIVVTENLFNTLVSAGWLICECGNCIEYQANGSTKRMLKKLGVDILSEYSWKNTYRAVTKDLIANADIIDDIPYVQLEELVKWKKACAREKDLMDVELIENYLHSKK